ncbi:MAG: PhaM family polyhydroxyalkanoate granule multifunctional regulatory protein [Hydrogenophaga sp.]
MSNPTSGLGFGQFVPGFEFLQNLVTPPAAAGQGMGMGTGMPNLGSWVAPTFNIEDLEKRIEELKAVHFWLEQNSKALAATIQAMEVQKMTLATLRDLNVNFSDIAKADEAASNAAAAAESNGFVGVDMPLASAAPVEPAPQARSEADPPSTKRPSSAKAKAKAKSKASEGAASGTVDAVQWWGALQQQFQNIAANAMQDLAKQSPPAAAKKARGEKPAAKPVAKKAAARPKTTPRSKAR